MTALGEGNNQHGIVNTNPLLSAQIRINTVVLD